MRERADEFPSIAPWAHGDAGFDARDASAFPEIDCVRELLPPDLIAAAEARARAIGVGADRVLIASGALTEEIFVRSLAPDLGLPFETLENVGRARCPLNDERLIESVAAGILPLTMDDEIALVVAPRDVRHLMAAMQSNPALAQRFRLTTAERLNKFAFNYGNATLGERAARALHVRWPKLSAAPPRWRANLRFGGVTALVALLALTLAPVATRLLFELALAGVFLAWMALRLAGVFAALPRRDAFPPLHDDELPIYTVISALYREAPSIRALLESFERFDYPREKLNILLVVEEDDAETLAAIAAYRGNLTIETIVAPPIGPRTKPKALNAALPFARGTFTVVFDAEDRPEPDQLRRALHAFRDAGDDLACVQAHLSIDNTADSWLTGIFTAEYAGQFDVFLPGIAALRLPLPLGGSSNHFRTETLRAVGGWDSYNVTEDADLGMRLARFGYRAGMIDSTTFEEAPARFWPWLRQRTRWFKGWMQTWMVHMREPRRLWRDLGPINFVSFQLVVGGNALAALVHPLFLGSLIYSLADGNSMWKSNGIAVTLLTGLYGTTAVIGYLASGFLDWIGLARRGLLSVSWVLLLMPVHWLLLSLAAWRALYQLLVKPYRWEKTEHGLAITSRHADVTRALSMLERHLSDMELAALVPAESPDAA
ncbi:MAG: glycosyltransferase [Pseudolabrys sp.]